MIRVVGFVLVALAVLGASARQEGTGQGVSFEELVAGAQAAQRQNDLPSAGSLYQQALKMRPNGPELHANLGLVDYQLGKAGEAIREFQTALRLKPSLFVPNLFLGIEYLKKGQPGNALTYLSRAAQLKPKDLEVNLSLGRTYTALDKEPEAISTYWNAVKLYPANEDGWYGLGASYLSRAESLSNLLAKRHRNSAVFQALSASYFDDQGKYEQAISEYRAMLSNPDAPPCSHARLGFALIHAGQFAQAKGEFKAELGRRNCKVLARIGLARIELQNAGTQAALAMLAQAFIEDPEQFDAHAFEFWKDLDSDTLSAFDRELQRETLDERARAAIQTSLQRAVKDDNSSDFAGSERSFSDPGAACLSGKYRSAAFLGEKLITSGDLSANTLYWTIIADQRLGVSALTQAISVAPRPMRIHLLLGDLYRRKGEYMAAQQEFQKVLRLDKNNQAALLGLATTFYLNGDFGPAERVASEVLATQPDDAEARLLMAEILLGQHLYEEALKYVNPIPNGKPDLTAEIHGVRGKIFAATRRPGDAIAELRKAVDNDPHGDLNYVLGRQYQLLGDKRSAELAFQRSKLLRDKFNERASYKFDDNRPN